MGIGWVIIVFMIISMPILADAQLDKRISEQNKIIKEDKIFLHENIDYLAQQKELSSKSWDALLSVEPAEQGVIDARQNYKDSRSELFVLLRERSDQIKLQKELDNQLVVEKTIQTIQNSTANLVRLIGIDLSKSCEISENCLNYSDLIYLDSSNQRISGKFIEVDGDIRRDKSPMEDSWRWYDMDNKTRIIVDPPSGMSDRIKMVTITNNLGVYFLGDDMNLSNYTRTFHLDRYVDNCRTAIIKNDLNLLDDTINYLRTGCSITSFNNTGFETLIPTLYDPRTSPNWLFIQWQNESKIKCRTLCFEY